MFSRGDGVEDANLRRHDDEAVGGDVIARRPQAVPVEHGADHRTVGERDRRRAIPRLHQRRMELVERLHFRRHRLVVRPRLGNHHQDGVRQRSSRHHQQLEHVVERGGVAAPFADDRQDLLQVVAEHRRLQEALARVHPVDVAAQRVDFAVVRDVAVRMRQRPRRKRIGAETLVHQRERRLHVRIGQIGKRRRDLIGRQHAFVNQRVGGEADDVKAAALGEGEPIGGVFDLLANDIQRAFETLTRVRFALGRRPPAVLDEQLLDDRFGHAGRRAKARVVARNHAPAEHGVPFSTHRLFDQLPQLFAGGPIDRQKYQAGAIVTCRRQCESSRGSRLAQEPIRHLNQDAGAVTGVGLAAAGAAVQQVEQDLQALLDDAVRTPALDIDHEADTARVVFVARIVETGRTRQRHGTPVITGLELEVKYNHPIEPMPLRNGRPHAYRFLVGCSKRASRTDRRSTSCARISETLASGAENGARTS